MKRIILLLISALFLQNALAQEFFLESKIQKGDEYWKNKRLSEAIQQYKLIIDNGSIPLEYQSLVYLRLAEAQYQQKLTEDCWKTLAKAKAVEVLPAHHQLKIKELENKLKKVPLTDRTPLPSGKKAVASFYISTNTNKVRVTGKKGANYSSIEDALDAARLKMQQPSLPEGSIEIIFDCENYEIDHPIKLTSKFSGTRRNPIIIKSASVDKKVVINGGRILKYWKKESNPEILSRLPEISKNSVWVADFKENNLSGLDSLIFGGFSSKRASGNNAAFKTFPVPELFIDGIPQKMARWPNDKDTLVGLKDFKDARIFNWAADKDVWFHGYWFHMWADAYEKMSGASRKDSTIELVPPVNGYGFGKSKWHVVNAFSEIDTPGEWSISVDEGKIWYFPESETVLDKAIISMTGPAFVAEDCDYLTIKGLDFKFIRGDGMLFTNCSNLTITQCSVTNTSGLGIKINGGKSQLLHSCTIESMGRGGIDINSGNKYTLESSGSVIENCKISNLSRIDRTYTPAILLDGVGMKVRHCLFSNIPSSAIRLEGNDMLIEMNEFTKCVIESDDQGAIDVWGNPLYRGNIIRWNFFHDIGIPNLHMAAGIRLDDAICGFSIYENLFLRSSNNLFGGIQIHGGKDNFIEGNIFAECHAAISQTAWGFRRWKAAMESEDHPMYKALHSTDWQSELWQSRYPDLKQLLIDPDRNFATDNIAINAESLILRKSDKFQLLNNQLLKEESQVKTATDYKNYLIPWHEIPLEKIGRY
jgi:hypothetical protein